MRPIQVSDPPAQVEPDEAAQPRGRPRRDRRSAGARRGRSARRMRWPTTEKSGTQQMSRLVSELVMCRSEVDIRNQGTPNSTTPKTAIHRRFAQQRGELALGDDDAARAGARRGRCAGRRAPRDRAGAPRRGSAGRAVPRSRPWRESTSSHVATWRQSTADGVTLRFYSSLCIKWHMRVGVMGATGYAGAEVLRLAAAHPDLEVVVATGSSSVGRRVADARARTQRRLSRRLWSTTRAPSSRTSSTWCSSRCPTARANCYVPALRRPRGARSSTSAPTFG